MISIILLPLHSLPNTPFLLMIFQYCVSFCCSIKALSLGRPWYEGLRLIPALLSIQPGFPYAVCDHHQPFLFSVKGYLLTLLTPASFATRCLPPLPKI